MRESDNAHLSTNQAAAYLGLSPKTLRNYRCLAAGPKFYKVIKARGGSKASIFYLVADLDAWRQVTTEPITPPPPVAARGRVR